MDNDKIGLDGRSLFPDTSGMTLGERIRKIRKSLTGKNGKEMSQGEFADKYNMSQTAISGWETDPEKFQRPLEKLLAMAKDAKINPSWLAWGIGEERITTPMGPGGLDEELVRLAVAGIAERVLSGKLIANAEEIASYVTTIASLAAKEGSREEAVKELHRLITRKDV